MQPMMRVFESGEHGMDNVQKKKGPRIHQLLRVLILVLMLPAPLFAGEAEKKSAGQLAGHGDFVLTIHEGLLSLKAQAASLKAILEEMGQKMSLDVLGSIPEDEKITTEFAKLPVAEALQRLSSNYGYQMKSEQGGQKMTKIFVLPKGTGTGLARQTLKASEPMEEPEFQISERVIEVESAKKKETDKEKPSRPEPFKFEFDPSRFMQKGK